MKPTILLIGLGHVGGAVLDLLAREAQVERIVACSRNAARGAARCRLALMAAAAHGVAPSIEYVPLDLDDRGQVAETVRRVAPDLVFGAVSMQTWWLADLLPPEAAERLRRARFGAWLPVHLAPNLQLMEALREAGYQGHTLTASYPDVVNVILGRLELAPSCGVGNIDEMAIKLQLLAAERLGLPLEAVRIEMVAHHALEPHVFGGGMGDPPPYFLRIEANGKEVSGELDAAQLLFRPFSFPPGPGWALLTAASVLRLIRALFSNETARLHAPGPAGLPGGYPVLVGKEGVRPAPIEGLRPEEAIDINRRSHRFEGIEEIAADGTVVFAAETVEAMREALGYECSTLNPGEAGERGRELIDRFREFARKQGVDLDAARF